jgi:hypothetical protein
MISSMPLGILYFIQTKGKDYNSISKCMLVFFVHCSSGKDCHGEVATGETVYRSSNVYGWKCSPHLPFITTVNTLHIIPE